MSKSAAEAAAKLTGTAKALEAAQRPALQQAGQVARPLFLGAPGAPHRVAGRATTVTARVVDRGGVSELTVRWNGPAHLVDRPTKPHDIRPKQFVGTRGTGKKAQRGAGLMAAFGLDAHSGRGAVRLIDGSLRVVVHHRGTKGKHFYQRGRDAAVPRMTAAYHKVVRETMGRFLRG